LTTSIINVNNLRKKINGVRELRKIPCGVFAGARSPAILLKLLTLHVEKERLICAGAADRDFLPQDANLGLCSLKVLSFYSEYSKFYITLGGGSAMWKESYRLGVETLDNQHRQLFTMVDHLLLVIGRGADDKREDYKKECADAVNFLYDYTVNHFRFEEGYQASIGYQDIEAHKLQHKRFIITVDNFAKRMLPTEYDTQVVKAFSGSLVAWLNYHVAEVDQKIVGKKSSRVSESLSTCLENFLFGALDVITSMLELKMDEITKTMFPQRQFRGDISFEIGLVGDATGKAVFTYERDFARSVIRSLMARDMDELDEIAHSAMAETSNIIGGKAAVMMSNGGKLCDITPPVMIPNRREAWELEGFHLHTPKGDMQVLLTID
jgi:hemerythrin